MSKVTIVKGLPGSGKTTWAKKQVLEKKNIIRVNKDDLRDMLHCGEHSKGKEKFILNVRDFVISTAVLMGQDVIVDDTNFNPIHEKRIKNLFNGSDINVEFEEHFIDTPLEECIKRDSKRGEDKVGKDVILNMYRTYLQKAPAVLEHDPTLPDCIIVDIDGTLAIKGDRDIYDESRVHLDMVVDEVRKIVNTFYGHVEIIVMSGRHDTAKSVTEEWLASNDVYYDQIHMRGADDNRCDTIVKKELYEEHVKGKYNVMFAIDDRKRVKRMWVEQGIFVFDVNQHDIEF